MGSRCKGWIAQRLKPALVALVLAVLPAEMQAKCSETTVFLRGDWGTARFNVEIADDQAERAVGLMHRDSLPKSAGMLFIYKRPQFLSFWMRNTLIPLDLIFLGPDGVVKHVHHNAIPLDETPINGGAGLTTVLEINGGLAKILGIAPGTQMRHPSFGPKAAWPC